MRNPSKNTIKALKRKYPTKFGNGRVSDFDQAKSLLWWESLLRWSDRFDNRKK